MMIRNTWCVVGLSGELAQGALHGMTVTGRPLVVWRDAGGSVHALDGRCIHNGSRSRKDGSSTTGASSAGTTASGSTVAGNVSASLPSRDRRHASSVSTVFGCTRWWNRTGVVWVWSGDMPPESGPPRAPEIIDPDWDVEPWGPCTVQASARLLVENLFDLTHFYSLHAGNIGTYSDSAVAVEIERSPDASPPLLGTTRRREHFRFGGTKGDWFGVEVGDNVATHEMVVLGALPGRGARGTTRRARDGRRAQLRLVPHDHADR